MDHGTRPENSVQGQTRTNRDCGSQIHYYSRYARRRGSTAQPAICGFRGALNPFTKSGWSEGSEWKTAIIDGAVFTFYYRRPFSPLGRSWYAMYADNRSTRLTSL